MEGKGRRGGKKRHAETEEFYKLRRRKSFFGNFETGEEWVGETGETFDSGNLR
jgi:hypothetical protein